MKSSGRPKKIIGANAGWPESGKRYRKGNVRWSFCPWRNIWSTGRPHMIEYFALVAAWIGEKELAHEHMEKATGLSGSGLLTQWDPLRGDPRFEKIVASVATKE